MLTTEAPAQTLRRAAALLHQRATGPHQSAPWIVRPDGVDGPEVESAAHSLFVAACEDQPTADYVALMHPGVALAIAESWDSLAAAMDRGGAYITGASIGTIANPIRPVVVEPSAGPGLYCLEWTHAWNASRALLGEATS